MTESSVPSVGFIDDSIEFLQSLQEQEEIRQISIKITDQPTECLQWVKENAIDILVADLRMPSADGLTILEEAQKVGSVRGVLLSAFEPTAAERTRAQSLGVTIFRKDSVNELLEYLEQTAKPVDQLLMRRLRQRLHLLERIYEEWSAELVSMLESIPERENAMISSSEGPFTVAQLIEDIQNLRPRGIEYVRLWRSTLGRFLRVTKNRDLQDS